MRKILILVVCLFLVGVAIFGYGFWQASLTDRVSFKNLNYSRVEVAVGDLRLTADVADSDPLRIQGLSGRQNLPDDKGMLFVFPRDDFYGFWMKDMFFPIDIIGFDSQKRVVWLERNMLPESFPTVFTPPRSVRYVLEAKAGVIDGFKIKIGDSGEWE